MKILIIRFSSIGDIVLTTPVIRAAHLQLGAEVHYLTKERYRELLTSNPYVHRIHCLGSSFQALIRELKKERFDRIIDLHHNIRSARVKAALGRPSRSFFKANIEKWLMVRFKINLLPKEHIVDRYLKTLGMPETEWDGEGLDFFFKEDKDLFDRLEIQAPFTAIALGAAHATKQIPVQLIEEVIRYRPGRYVLLGGDDVTQSGEQLARQFSQVQNLCGKLSMAESAQVIRDCQCLITGDTGMMHIGAALQIPMISVWGNTIPELGMYPYYGKNGSSRHRLIEQSLSCRPCSKTGFKVCPKGHFKCMLNHDPILLSNALDALGPG